jgi:hypothetical protein
MLALQMEGTRNHLGCGTIVDLRPFARTDLSSTFGMFLGFVALLARPEDLADDERLIAAVARASSRARRDSEALSGQVQMATAILGTRVVGRENAVEFYRRRVPLCGGISNVNLTRTWAAEWSPSPLLDYVRVSPVAPMLPFVVSATTLGERFHVVLTRRPSVVKDSAEAAFVASFFERLRAWS